MNLARVRFPLVRLGIGRRSRVSETAARLLTSIALVLQTLLPALFGAAHIAEAASGTVRARTASVSISLDTSSQSPGTGGWTTIQLGPVATESSAGAYASGTTVTLSLPTGFEFRNPVEAGTKAEVNAETTYLRFADSGSLNYRVTPTLTGSTLTVEIGRPSDSNRSASSPASIEFSSLQIRPTNGTPTSGTLVVAGTAGAASNNAGALSSVAGESYGAEFSTQPAHTGNVTSALSTQPVVKLKDRFGNYLSTGTVTLSLVGGTSAATLTGCHTATINASTNLATFSGCSVNTSGTGYTLVASSGAATAVSNSFNVTAVAPSAVAVKALSGTNTANWISLASQASTTFDVSFPTGGPGEAGTVTVTLTQGTTSVSGTAAVTAAQTSVTVGGVNASSFLDDSVTVTAKFTGGRDSAVTTGTVATKDTDAPDNASAATAVATGGTVVPGYVNANNTGITATASVTSSDFASAGTAELLLGGASFSPAITAAVAANASSVTISKSFASAAALQLSLIHI